MKALLAAAALIATTTSTAAVAQRGPGASIPLQFHGRWAPTPRACRGSPAQETILTIDRRGWSGWEEGGRVQRLTRVAGGTYYWRVSNFHGAEDNVIGAFALRRAGPRLIMSFNRDGQEPTHFTLVRCR